MEYTPSPRLMVLQNVVSALKTAQATEVNLRQAVDIVANDLNELLLLEQDETIFSDPTSKARWEIMKKAILAYQKGLSTMSRYFQDKNMANLDKGLEEVSLADRNLYDIYAEMNAIFQKAKEELEAALFVKCIYCGAKNNRDAKLCLSCGKPLTKGFQTITEYSDMDEDTGQIQEIYEEVEEDYSNITKLKELAYGVLNGTAPVKELISYAEELKGLFRGALNQFEAVKSVEKNLYPEITHNINAAKEAIGELMSILESLILNTKSADFTNLETQITRIDELANSLGSIKQSFISISQQLSG